MPGWLQIVLALGGSTLISSLVTFIITTTVSGFRKGKRVAKGTQALLRHELYGMYNTCKVRGYSTVEEKQDFENMYKSYHDLGKNGVMDAIYLKFLALPDEQKFKRLNG